jgi:hypothetical protein
MNTIPKFFLAAAALSALENAHAYDLTPDRGRLISSMPTSGIAPSNLTGSSYADFDVFNIDPVGNYGPISNAGTIWSSSQWWTKDGKKQGTKQDKNVVCQYDFSPPLSNGWFTPAPQGGTTCDGTASHISSGWQDIYGGQSLAYPGASSLDLPSINVKVDPLRLLTSDKNLTNNEAFVTMKWNSTTQSYYPVENVDVPAGTKTLAAGDSLYYGAYSTDPTKGNITVTSTSAGTARNYNLLVGNQKVGFQGRRLKMKFTGGGKSAYVIKNAATVTMYMLQQNQF